MYTPDELRTLIYRLAVAVRISEDEAADGYAAADAWDETERRLFDSHGMVMDLRKQLEVAEQSAKKANEDAGMYLWEVGKLRERLAAANRLMRRFVDENCGHRKCYECDAEEQEPHDSDCLVGLCVSALAGRKP